MREWDDLGRKLGPGDPSSWQSQDRPEDPPRDSVPDPEDEFNPRYCVRCRKRIPVMMSERQDACDECLAALEMIARGMSPDAMPPGPGEKPPCPNCGGRAVEKEWRTDWLTRAVDVAAGVATIFFTYDRDGVPIDARSEVGPAKVMTYRCLTCDERWKPRR